MQMLTDFSRTLTGRPAPRPGMRIPVVGTQVSPGYGGDTLTGMFGGVKPTYSFMPSNTDATLGKTDWWSLLVPLLAAGAGAKFGGKRGALAGGVAALQGMATEKHTRAAVEKAKREEEKSTREEQRRIQKEKKEEIEQKKTARQQAATFYAIRKVQTPDLHLDDMAAIDNAEYKEMERKRKEKEAEEARERQRELDREARAEEREKEREKRTEGREKEREGLKKKEKEAETEEKPVEISDIKIALENLKNEKEEIEKAGVYPKDAQGKIVVSAKKTFTPQQQSRLNEIDSQVARIRASQAQSVLTKLGKARGKTKTDTTEVIPQEEINKLKEAVRIYREKGLTDEEIREKMIAIPSYVLKILGL